MRKLYFIVSIPKSHADGIITGVVANGMGRDATEEETKAVAEQLREKGASDGLLDSLRDGMYPNPISIFDRRADARMEAALLNSYTTSFFNWHVLSVGDSIRKPVRKPLGWRILYSKEFPSAFNRPGSPEMERVIVDHARLYDGCTAANYLFKTREGARLELRDAELVGHEDYSIVPVYADA